MRRRSAAGHRSADRRGWVDSIGVDTIGQRRAALGSPPAVARTGTRSVRLSIDEPANNQMEPTRPMVRAIMSVRRAAHLER